MIKQKKMKQKKMKLKRSLLVILTLMLGSLAIAQNETKIVLPQSDEHPSLLIKQGDEILIRKSINESPSLKIIHEIIVQESDKLLAIPCLKYQKIGKRLLDVSRECFRRVFFLSYSYRITGDEKYAKRTEDELLAVCAFENWNPTHFLDVAEMTLAVSIGYDWVYNYLSKASRGKISDAIINNGIKPSMNPKYNSWLNEMNNWNQVCNTGIIFGAIAIKENDPELAQTIINRSFASLPKSMKGYEPDGNYPEGFMYWGYGTTFNVFFISAMEKYFGREMFLMDNMPGFARTGSYMLNMVGPTGKSFNYSDCNNSAALNPAIFWFAQKERNPGLLWNEKKYIITGNRSLRNDRFLPAAILWGAGLKFDAVVPPKSNLWVGQGETPVCLMRTSWTDKNAIFLGLKAGTPSADHSHMDVGSFVMDANGVRWACDYGSQDYITLESKGVDLWNKTQFSQRWQVFRYNNLSHNTLTFNDSLQRVEGNSKIDSYADNKDNIFASSDISQAYAGQVKKVIRTCSIVDNSFVTVKDQISTLSTPTKVRWTMLTEAEPKLIHCQNTIELTKNGKKLVLKVDSKVKVTLKTWSTQSKNDFDASNTGTYLVGFEAQLPSNSTTTLLVTLTPQK